MSMEVLPDVGFGEWFTLLTDNNLFNISGLERMVQNLKVKIIRNKTALVVLQLLEEN